MPADYDADGAAHPAVFRPSTGAWFVGGQAAAYFGLSGESPSRSRRDPPVVL